MSGLEDAPPQPTPVDSQALCAFDVRGLADDPRLKAITDFAAALCGTPIALVSFVDEERQWFAARTGLATQGTPRRTSFCAHAMLHDDVMVVPDTAQDSRFADNALVTGDPFIRFYAGAPLVAEDGTPLGALCVIDHRPRPELSDVQMQGLRVLAANVMSLLILRRDHAQTSREREESETRFRILADTMPQMVWSTLPDGYHDYYNARWYEYTGMPEGSTDGEAWNGMFHPDDQARAWAVWRHSLETGEPYEIEYRLRNAAGQYRWTLGRALPIRDEAGAITRWFGTCTDIHDGKLLLEQREIISQELNHRIKNIFSIISGLISLTTRFHPEMRVGAEALRERVLALGRAHNVIVPEGHVAEGNASGRKGAQNSLHAMLDPLLAPYRQGANDRIAIEGQDVPVDDRAATPFALLFHELATNAAKYGALAQEGGTVTIRTGTIPSATSKGAGTGAENTLARIEWEENGTSAPASPGKEGFGSKLIEMSIVRQLGGTISRDWRPEGLAMRVEVPLTSLSR